MTHICPANGKRPAVRQPAERKVGSERENRRPKQAARRNALLGVHTRKGDSVRHAIQYGGRRDGHQQGWAARIVVSVQGILSRVGRAVIHRSVMVMVTVMVVVVTMVMVIVVTMTTLSLAVIARRVSVDQKVREDAGRRPMGHADDRRERKQKHHRPHQSDEASGRFFQSRQHPSRSLAMPIASMGSNGSSATTPSLPTSTH